jgi:hypothetical protein
MSIKLPLERWHTATGLVGLEVVSAGDAVALERAYADACKERDELRAWQLAVAEGTGYINHAEGQGGYEIAPAETIVAAYANAVEERDEARAEVARLKRIEAAALANLKQGHFDESRVWMLEAILAGIGPDGEVKP